MNVSAGFVRRLHWLNLPGVLLIALLQRTPVLRVAASVGEIIHASPLGAILRATVAATASLGAMHTLAGATQIVINTTNVAGTVGSAVQPVVFSTSGAPSAAGSFSIGGTLPPGVTAAGAVGGIINNSSGLLSGTPTSAGTFDVTITAWQFAGATGSSFGPQNVRYTITGVGTVPAITTQPVNQTVNVGATATFTVVFTGSPTPTVQWRKDGVAITGATLATLTLPSITVSSAGVYSALLTNTTSTATSSGATLTVNTPPTLTTQPASQTVVSDSTVTFTVATAAAPVTYQWRKNAVAITGNASAATASLTLPRITTATAGTYDCTVTNTVGTTTSTAATLTVTRIAVSITLGAFAVTYDGSPKSVSASTTPSGLPVSLAYAGSATAPTAAGTYVVTAVVNTSEAEGSISGQLTIAKAAQTVTFGALPTALTPGIAFTLNASASSALPVGFSVVSGNATVGGNTVVLADTAPVTLRANQNGNTNYLAAIAETTVTATKLAQTITVTSPLTAQVSSAGPFTLAATATSGLPVTFTAVSGPASLTGSVLTLTGVAGTVVVRSSQPGNATYSAAPAVDFSFAVTAANIAPALAAQPTAQVAQFGGIAVFSVSVTGTPSPTFQWRKEGVALPGATTATLALNNLQTGDAAGYDVVVTNAAGSVTSSVARLTLTAADFAPAILTAPTNQTVAVGQSVTFTVVASGQPAPTYQWLKNNVALVGATSSTLSLPTVQLSDSAAYVVRVTNSAGSVSSAAVTLTTTAVLLAPTITTQPPATLTLTAGQPLTLRIGAAGSGLAFQWRRVSGGVTTLIPGATDAVFVLTTATSADSGTYLCTVSNSVGSVDSVSTIVAINAPTVVSARLINLSVLTALTSPGDSFSLGYVVNGANPANPQPLVIRAAGPSLGALGVAGTLSDPKLELFASATKTGENDDWGGSPLLTKAMAAVGAFPYAAAASRDAAVTASITSRDNSVKISVGANAAGATGTVIGEVYDASDLSGTTDLSAPRLINLSVLKQVGSSLTLGFVLGGGASQRMLIRAIGPTLGSAPFNVGGALADPKIELFDDSGKSLATNDNWGGTAALAAAFAQTGAFVLSPNSRDAALLVTLAAGNYTAQVTVATGSTGVALVEVYEVP